MKNSKILLVVALFVVGFVLSACGGGAGSHSVSGGTTGSNPLDINVSKAIQDGKIIFENTDTIDEKYLKVINYFRDLNIKCNDTLAVVGPSNPLVWNDSLFLSSKEHSEDMSLSEYYGHDGSGTTNDTTGQGFTPPRASNFHERIDNNGYRGTLTAENIASFTTTYIASDDVWLLAMEGWIKSEHGHCSNIMHHSINNFGMYESRADINGDGKYITYWTQDFGGD